MHRIVKFVDQVGLSVKLAYYPPYHSKYNPVERVWGFLEQYWNGSLLDLVATVLDLASSFSFKDVATRRTTRLHHLQHRRETHSKRDGAT